MWMNAFIYPLICGATLFIAMYGTLQYFCNEEQIEDFEFYKEDVQVKESYPYPYNWKGNHND